MTDLTGPPSTGRPPRPQGDPTPWITAGMMTGVVLALVGAVDGFLMAAHRVVAQCADGTLFSPGQEAVCYAHPHAGIGIAIIAVSVMLGVVVMLCGTVAAATVNPRSSANPD